MSPFRYHVFICDQGKPEGMPCCAARGSARVIEVLRREVAAQGLSNEVQITACGSLGLCDRGPNMVVYPEGTWYSNLTPQDIPEIVRTHFQGGSPAVRLAHQDAPALKAEILSQREKMLAAQRSREAAGVLPDEVSNTLRAFQESRVLLTAVEMDLFSAVGSGAGAQEVSGRIGSHPRATEMLMNALTGMGWLRKQDNIFFNTPLGTRFFVAGSADDARAPTLHLVYLWNTWSTLTASVRAGTAVFQREMADRGEEWRQAFIAAMHRNAQTRAPQVANTVGTEEVNRMLDVGGGSGAYSIAFANAKPSLQVVLLDLAQVLPIAEGHIARAGLAGRIQTRAGDLRADKFGEGYDLVFVSAICHMLGPEENKDLLKRCHEALAPNGRVVIQDFILEPDRTAPKSAALFALNMLVGTANGNTYTETEYAAWLGEAGFREVRQMRLPGPAGLIVGRRG
jgi:(2Fe-2S) ferredoxin/cyclopropane fatty-acyl-phospholipid synthase-like methyltransferase